MTKDELISYCRYYKGEEVCPVEKWFDPTRRKLWHYERSWLNDTLQLGESAFMGDIEEYDRYCGNSFKLDLPKSLLARLFAIYAKPYYSKAYAASHFSSYVCCYYKDAVITKDSVSKEEEIRELVYHILTLLSQLRSLKTEKQKKDFLFELAWLNSLANKGYCAQRTPNDSIIYDIKSAACQMMVQEWPNRCRYDRRSFSHDSVLYIFADRRQYSFHVELNFFTKVAKADYDEWDNIKYGWELSDESYFNEVEIKRKTSDTHIVAPGPRTQNKDFLQMLVNYKKARELFAVYEARKTIEGRVWEFLERRLPLGQKKFKCYERKDYPECCKRYEKYLTKAFTEQEMSIVKHSIARVYTDREVDICGITFKDQHAHTIMQALINGEKISSELLYRGKRGNEEERYYS